MIQIRHVPERVHRVLRARAKRGGQSLSDYLRLRVEQWAEEPTMEDWLKNLKNLPRPKLVEPPAVTIRRERDSR